MNINESKAADQQQRNIPPPSDNPQFQLEFWTNFLARNQPTAVNTPQNVAISAAAAALFQPQQQINTNIRLPPPFNLTATIQYLLSRTSAHSNSLPPQQNPAFLLQQALFGGQQIGLNPGGGGETFDGGLLKKEEEDGEETSDLAANLAEEIGIGIEGQNPMNIKNELNDGIMNGGGNESPILGENDEEVNNNNIDGPSRPQQQRRPRVGGSSAKTAEVWRFFTQRPDGEQAATCSICQKTIKATNSSTTGMIRHLKSCHHEQHIELQKARWLKALKNVSADSPMREEYLRQLGIQFDNPSEAIQEFEKFISALENPSDISPTMVAPKHSVESLISPENRDSNGPQILPQNAVAAQLPMEQRQFFEQIENFKTMNRPTSIERQQKKKEMIGPTGIVDGGGQGQGHHPPNAGKRTIMEEGGEVGNGPDQGGIIQQQNVIDHFREPPKRRKEELAEPGMAPTEKMAGITPKVATTNGGKRSRKSTAAPTMPQNLHPKMMIDENGRESARISEQMAAMFLVDNTEFLLDRIAFRQFIHSIIPNYQMPSKEQFRNEIIPRVARQFEQLAHFRGEMQRNNPFGLPFVVAHQSAMAAAVGHSMNLLNSSCASSSSSNISASHSSSIGQSATSPVLSTPSISNNSVISPSSSAEESGFHDEESPTICGDNGGQHQHQQTHLKLKDAEELVQLTQMATTLFQNIPRSFIETADNNDG